MTLDPKPGLVIRYDFLWRDQQQAGLDSGKDRPSAIVMTSGERPDGSKDVLLCPITHSPPGKGEAAVKVPEAVARHLGLDSLQSWIKTDQANRLTWEKGRIPYGVSPVRKGEWSYGTIPQGLGKQVLAQVLEKARSRSLDVVPRDEPPKARAKDWTADVVRSTVIKPLPKRDKDRDRDR